jgi:hypothetical protein
MERIKEERGPWRLLWHSRGVPYPAEERIEEGGLQYGAQCEEGAAHGWPTATWQWHGTGGHGWRRAMRIPCFKHRWRGQGNTRGEGFRYRVGKGVVGKWAKPG